MWNSENKYILKNPFKIRHIIAVEILKALFANLMSVQNEKENLNQFDSFIIFAESCLSITIYYLALVQYSLQVHWLSFCLPCYDDITKIPLLSWIKSHLRRISTISYSVYELQAMPKTCFYSFCYN